MTIQQEIKTGMGGLRMGARAYNNKNYPSFLSPDDIKTILTFLASKGVVIQEAGYSPTEPLIL